MSYGVIKQLKHYEITKLQRRTCKLILGFVYTHLEKAYNRLRIQYFVESVCLNMYEMVKILRHHFIFNRFVSNEKLFS